ncbi:hypothetical protein RR48_07167 [Papilio machaon]|uniref:Uncharacterized protein n=1 Tax=Papilio machaon TaxID=76193 RepID=A0A194RIM8_PAPMA|nr:hypothetical protein RR48_07167 [Papilio machaon]
MTEGFYNGAVISHRSGEVRPEVEVQQLVWEAGRAVFGESGAPRADVLRARSARALLRVPASQHRRLRAALALAARPLRVRKEAPSLQALI